MFNFFRRFSSPLATLRFAYFILALLAVLLTAIIVSFTRPFFKKTRVEIAHKRIFPREYIEFYFNDFDHDGYSEKVEFKSVGEGLEFGCKFYTSKDLLIDQWNFSDRWITKSISFTDFDGDGYDEVYFFTLDNDSLFLYSFDPRQRNRFLIYRKLIASVPRPNPHPQKKWDISVPNVAYYDSDNDGFQEMYINLTTGFSLQPRQVLKFDIKKKKIVARSPFFGAVLARPEVVDIDQDGQKEILMRFASTPDNYHRAVPYRDNSAWLMVFDKDLNFFFPPKEFPHFTSGLMNQIWNVEGKNYIVSLRLYHGALDINPGLFVFDAKGKLLKKKPLDRKFGWNIATLPKSDRNRLFLFNHEGSIFELNFDLEIIKTYKLSPPLYTIHGIADFDGDLEDEYLGIGWEGYVIAESDFNYSVPIGINPASYRDIINIIKRGDHAEFSIQTNSMFYHFKYVPNPWGVWRYLIWLAIFVVQYLILFLIFYFILYNSGKNTLFRQFVQFSPLGLLVMDVKGRVQYINGNFEQLLGLNFHVDEKKHYSEVFAEHPQLMELLDRLFQKPFFLEKQISKKGEKPIDPVQIRGMLFKGAFNVPAGFLVEAFSASSKMDTRLQIWSRTVQKMAHDIKTPLSTLQLTLQTLKMRIQKLAPDSMDRLENDFQVFENELVRVREMTKQFLRFSNLEKPKRQLVSLKELIDRTLRKFTFYLQDNLQIRVELDSKIDKVWIDPVLIEMVFQILLENAIDALGGKGTILIHSSLIESLEENFKKFLEIEIIDNGPGIAPEHLDKIFDPFFTTKTNGTGMGLTLAKKIIEEHGGTIHVDSKPGTSTVVRIHLPLDGDKEHEG